MNNSSIKHGFILIALALIFGFFIPSMEVPRLGLSAHTIGVLSGILLIALGAVWKQFSLSVGQLSIMYWAWLYSSYINWLGCLVGAIFGAGNTTPVASADYVGVPVIENIVTIMLMSVGVSSLVAVGLSIYGLSANEKSDT